MSRDYRTLKTWKLADNLVMAIYRETINFPKEETYGLTSQTRRAVVSVAANIAEGSAHSSQREFSRFLQMAKGSLSEVSYYLHLARRLGYLESNISDPLDQQCEETAKTLAGLIKALRHT